MKQILVDGHLGRDAEIREAANGKKYVSFSLANNTHIKNEDKTTWYDVLCFDQNTIDNRVEYLKKGKYIFVTGVYDCKAYVGKDGSLRISESIVADRINFINTGRNDGQPQQSAPQNSSDTDNKESYTVSTGVMPQQSVGASATPAYAAQSSEDDELPF